MKTRLMVVLLFICAMIVAWYAGLRNYFTLEKLQLEGAYLQAMVDSHYAQSVMVFIFVYFCATLLFLPFVAVLTLAGGFLFGTFLGAVYTNVGATIGSMCAFIFARHFLGSVVQERFKTQLIRFNRAMQEGQTSYLLAIHFIAIIPFPLVNLLAALTRVPLWTFVWTTSVGIFPGSLIYSFAGRQLATIHHLKDIFSLKIMLAFIMLAALAFLPMGLQYVFRKKPVQ